MLFDLYIENFVLIESISIKFTKGLNIITGETGAGKSIVFKAIDLILGGKASKDIIKIGKETSVLQGSFDISDNQSTQDTLTSNGVSFDDNIICISRELSRNGRSISRINGRLVASSLIKEISASMVEITGQHEHQHLLKQQNHIHLLDSFGAADIESEKAILATLFQQVQVLKRELDSINYSEEEIERRIDLLKFQIDEIENEGLKDKEDEELENKFKYLSNFSNIIDIISKARYEIFEDGGAFTKLESVNESFQSISSLDDNLKALSEEFGNVFYSLENLASQIRDVEDNYTFDEEEMYNIEKRLDTINTLKKKYGKTIAEIFNFKSKLEIELEEVTNLTTKKEKLISIIDEKTNSYHIHARKLSDIRSCVAKTFEEIIINELIELDISNANFKINIEKNSKMSENGTDRVEFSISTNIGDPLRSIGKVVSGGELSRLMLAIKLAIGKKDFIPTLIFDEIDSGISGRTASTVGDKISSISRDFQVIAVTHLPQIAVHADNHLFIEKVFDTKSTVSYIRELVNRDRVFEIGRMLSGEIVTKNSLENAEDMINRVKVSKRGI